MAVETTEDTLLAGRVKLLQPRRGYRVAVDPVLLAAAIDARAGQRVLDLGCGTGAVALCLAARVPGLQIVGVELQATFAELAERSAALNGSDVRIVQHDIANPQLAELGLFDHVATNPPFLAAAVADVPPDQGKALATIESSANLTRWIEVAVSALKPDGTLTMIHRDDRLEEIASHFAHMDVTVKRLSDAGRVLIRARKGRSARREATPLALHRPGGYSDAAEAILRHARPLAF